MGLPLSHCLNLIVLLLSTLNLFAQPNLIDRSFGEDGMVRPRFDRKPIYDGPELDKKDRLMLVRDTLINGNDYATVIYRYNKNGQLDFSFNGNGRLFFNLFFPANSEDFNYEYVSDIHFLNDNSFTIDIDNGINGTIWWLRLNENGTFDTQFGTNGRMQAPVEYYGYNTAITTDNKIVTAVSTGTNIIKVSKFNTNGSPDNGFGTAGVRTIDIGMIGGETEYVDDLAIDATGNLFIIGWKQDDSLVVLKLNPNGTVHSGYGTNGFLEFYLETEEGEYFDFYDYQFASDGKLMAYGEDDIGNTALVRFTTGGIPDNSFGNSGILLLPYLGGDKAFYSFAPSSGSGIWLCGIAKEQNYYRYLISKRLNNGNPDNSFGNNGYLTLNINNQDAYSYGIKEIAGGKIFVVGSSLQDHYYGTTVVQLLPNGQLDNSYANNGKLYIMGVDPNSNNDYEPTTALSHVIAGPDKTILSTGYYEDGSENGGSFFVSSHTENGTILNSFGNEGYATISALFGNETGGGKIVRQPDGKIVIAHIVYDLFTDGTSILLQRLTSNGQADISFGTLGRTLIPYVTGEDIEIVDLKSAPNGKLGLLIEYYDDLTEESNSPLYQLTANGILDNSFSGDGKLIIPGLYATHLAYNSQNKPILLGEQYTEVNGDYEYVNMAIQRFNENGTADNSFNSGNMRAIQLSDYDEPSALIMEEGDILTILFETELEGKDYGIAKLGTNGLPLPNWGVNGIVAGYSGTTNSYWENGIRLDNGGYLFQSEDNETDLELLKTTAAGIPDINFGNNGRGLIDLDIDGSFYAEGMVLNPGGKLIVGGNDYIYSQNQNNEKNEMLITQINLNAPQIFTYTLINPGNWSNPDNWQSGQVPPSTIPPGLEIIINPGGNGEAILDMSVVVQQGGKIIVKPGKKLNVVANLTVPAITIQ